MAQGRVAGMIRTRNNLARKRLTPDARIAELEHDLDAAQHLLHEIIICAFRREHGRDPATPACKSTSAQQTGRPPL